MPDKTNPTTSASGRQRPTATARSPSAAPRRLRSTDLLQDSRELLIEHAGEDYRLRLTSNGKLILTK